MEYTNNYGLPGPLVRAVAQQDINYAKGHKEHYDISVTGLLQPPQIGQLLALHQDDLSEDVSGRIWALLGQLMHKVLEDGADPELVGQEFVERRFNADVDGWIVSGQADRLAYDPATDQWTLQDYKLCSVWEHIGGLKPDRENQLNILAYLIAEQQESLRVDKVEIVSVYRDWSMTKAAAGGDYPQSQVAVHSIPLWDEEDQYAFISERIELHKRARAGEQVDCTPEDTWEKPTKYAVMRQGRKTALKLYDNQRDATDRITAEGDGRHYLEVRHGERTRCKSYCPVAEYCPQYQKWQVDHGGG